MYCRIISRRQPVLDPIFRRPNDHIPDAVQCYQQIANGSQVHVTWTTLVCDVIVLLM
jgi:hypothetical protein